MRNPYDHYITPEEYEAAAKNGISASTLWYRVYDLYWDKEVAISKSPQRATEWRSVKETALRNGISRNAFNKRRRRGWNLIDSITKPPMSREEALKCANQCNRKYSKLTEEQIQIFKSNGLKPSTVYMRIRKLKWEIEEAITTPVLSSSEAGRRAKETSKFSKVVIPSREERMKRRKLIYIAN
ncbi:TPA: hypothetical protein QCX89_000484 [Bacillus cereus]|nr:hypothetical protein [Bacillus cereus]